MHRTFQGSSSGKFQNHLLVCRPTTVGNCLPYRLPAPAVAPAECRRSARASRRLVGKDGASCGPVPARKRLAVRYSECSGQFEVWPAPLESASFCHFFVPPGGFNARLPLSPPLPRSRNARPCRKPPSLKRPRRDLRLPSSITLQILRRLPSLRRAIRTFVTVNSSSNAVTP